MSQAPCWVRDPDSKVLDPKSGSGGSGAEARPDPCQVQISGINLHICNIFLYIYIYVYSLSNIIPYDPGLSYIILCYAMEAGVFETRIKQIAALG